MKWLRRFFKRYEEEELFEHSEIPFSTIMRWSLYDLSVPSPNEIAVMLGLSPVSDEGNEKEIQDSEDRLIDVDSLLPFMDIISELNAKIIVATQIRDSALDIDSEEAELMEGLYKFVSFSALISAFSSGIHLGMIHTNALLTGSAYKEDYE